MIGLNFHSLILCVCARAHMVVFDQSMLKGISVPPLTFEAENLNKKSFTKCTTVMTRAFVVTCIVDLESSRCQQWLSCFGVGVF